MHRFKNILAVYGDRVGTDDVLSRSVVLARTNGARLTLVEVVPEKYATKAEVAERRKRLGRLVPAIELEGVKKISVKILVGVPFLEITRQVLRSGHDLVVASAEGGASLRSFYFGSTATHLMRKCPCPVWIIKPNHPHRYANILACIDPKPGKDPANKLDQRILDLATSLAEINASNLHVVHAWEVEGEDRDTISSEVHDDTYISILQKHEALHRGRVDGMLADYPMETINHQIYTPRGSPRRAILDLIDLHDFDLIVMGTVSRTGIAGLIIGNTAETILSVVRCGMFTVKPKDFSTPIILEEQKETT